MFFVCVLCCFVFFRVLLCVFCVVLSLLGIGGVFFFVFGGVAGSPVQPPRKKPNGGHRRNGIFLGDKKHYSKFVLM